MGIFGDKWYFKNYYFKCSTGRCNGFGVIKRFDKSLLFQLKKKHSIDYYSHTYYKKIICDKDLLDENVTKDAWSKENLRYQLFKWYFYNYKDGSEESCKLFFKEKLKDIFEINE